MEQEPLTYMKIMLVEETKQLRVNVELNSNIMHNILSYEVWEAWGAPSLRHLDPHFQKTFIGQLSIGSFIANIKVYDSMQCCFFYVAKKDKV